MKIENGELRIENEDFNNAYLISKLSNSLFSIFDCRSMTFLIGKDINSNINEIELTLAEGLRKLGANVFLLGVTTASAISFATKSYKAVASIFFKSSNQKNKHLTIQIFNGNGFKITDEQLSALEYRFFNLCPLNPKAQTGRAFIKPFFNEEYLLEICKFKNFKMNKFKIFADLDCGSAYEIYHQFCTFLGFDDFSINSFLDKEKTKNEDENNQINEDRLRFDFLNNYINDNRLLFNEKKEVLKLKDEIFFNNTKNDQEIMKIFPHCDYFIKFDEECEKLTIFEKNGKIIEGDVLLAIFAKMMKKSGKKVKVVTTFFTNNEILNYFEKNKIEYSISKSDNLTNDILKKNADLGGEKFGRIINFNYSNFSDAFLTLLIFLNAINSNAEIIEEVLSIKFNYQRLKKLPFKKEVIEGKIFKEVLHNCEALLENSGKIIVKKINNKIIIFVESEDKKLADEIIHDIEDIFYNC